mmetsp:Transcript_9806/g.24208  ORF Transcript_9806/g.24208 Transcript_9806/m.24208 type:complete len:135 (+) Transcript_9806:171-575(+)
MPQGNTMRGPSEDVKSAASLPAAFARSFGKTFKVKAEQVMHNLSPTISPMQSPAWVTRTDSGHSTSSASGGTVVTVNQQEYESIMARSLLNEVEAESQLLHTQSKLLDAQSELQSTLHALELAKQRSFKRASSV